MATKRKGGLGRGLGAILSETAMEPMDSVTEIPVSQIEANPFQPRNEFDKEALEELAESIRAQGIIQPITVRKLGAKQFQLIAGERRLRASKLAGLEQIPAFIRTADDEQMLEMALIENIQRQDLNAIEIALSYKRLIEELGLKQESLADKVGKKRATISNYLRLLRLPPEIQAGLRDGKISMGHARTFVTVEDPIRQLTLYHQVVDKSLSVRQTEALLRKETPGQEQKETSREASVKSGVEQVQMKKLESELEEKFGNKVALLVKGGGKGEIRIQFHSTEDLNRILEILEI
jgi:ParB family chromosome partitioning protein